MKQIVDTNGVSLDPSLPSRERGLKRKLDDAHAENDAVAPFTGAWIETTRTQYPVAWLMVAPFTGAWIET